MRLFDIRLPSNEFECGPQPVRIILFCSLSKNPFRDVGRLQLSTRLESGPLEGGTKFVMKQSSKGEA